MIGLSIQSNLIELIWMIFEPFSLSLIHTSWEEFHPTHFENKTARTSIRFRKFRQAEIALFLFKIAFLQTKLPNWRLQPKNIVLRIFDEVSGSCFDFILLSWFKLECTAIFIFFSSFVIISSIPFYSNFNSIFFLTDYFCFFWFDFSLIIFL